jgi:hypothetical protein
MTYHALQISYKKGKPAYASYLGCLAVEFSKVHVGEDKYCWLAEYNNGTQIVHDALNMIAVFVPDSDDPTIYTCPKKKTTLTPCSLRT